MNPTRRSGPLPPTFLVLAAVGLIAFLVHLDVLGLVFVALAVAGVVAVSTGARERHAEQPGDVYGTRARGADEEALDVAQWRLAGQLDDPGQIEGSLRPRLTTLVTERLARRGTALSDPGARDLLGEPLWALLTGPPRIRTLPLRELENLLTRVEGL